MPKTSPNKLSIYVTLDPRKFLSLVEWLAHHNGGHTPPTTAETLRHIVDLAYNVTEKEFPACDNIHDALEQLRIHFETVTTRNEYGLNIAPRIQARYIHTQTPRIAPPPPSRDNADRINMYPIFTEEWFMFEINRYGKRDTLSAADIAYRQEFVFKAANMFTEQQEHYPNEYARFIHAVSNEHALWEE